jgi:ribonuclease T1
MAAPVTGRQRFQWGLLLLVSVILLAWLFVGDTGQDAPSGSTSASSTSPSSSPSAGLTATGPSTDPTDDTGGDGGTDPESGLPIVQLSDLPPEAAETLDLIDAGGPFPEDRDGVTFENREDLLPDHPVGYYKEYTVPTPGSDDRGARRIVVGEDGELYYTGDHYSSFSRIAR